MAQATNANPALPEAVNDGYDPSGHQANVVFRVVNVQTDTNITPNVTYGDLAVNASITNANTNGQATMANSAPVVIASDQIVPVKGSFTETASLSAGSLNADLVPSTDVSGYARLSLQVTGTWSGTLTAAFSNDNTNFVTAAVIPIDGVSTFSLPRVSITGNDIFSISVRGRYFRCRMTGYSSGTANGTLEAYTTATALEEIVAYAEQAGTWTVQPGNTPNTTPWLIAHANNNASVPTGAANTVIKNAAGALATIVVTTAGTGSGNVQIFDNASTNSGTVLFAFPATVAVAQFYQVYGWAKNGMTVANVANGPVFTVYYA